MKTPVWILDCLMWASFFALSWLRLTRVVERDLESFLMNLVFAVLAVGLFLIAWAPPKEGN